MDVSKQRAASLSKLIAFTAGGEGLKNPDGSYQAIERSTFNETWAEMEQVLASGKVRAIGISNFSIKKLVLYQLERSECH